MLKNLRRCAQGRSGRVRVGLVEAGRGVVGLVGVGSCLLTARWGERVMVSLVESVGSGRVGVGRCGSGRGWSELVGVGRGGSGQGRSVWVGVGLRRVAVVVINSISKKQRPRFPSLAT